MPIVAAPESRGAAPALCACMNRILVFFVLLAGTAPAWTEDVRVAAQQIDELLAQDWQKHSLQGNAPASDEIFVRRIYLDLVGRIPTHEETVSFLNNRGPDKRAQLVDRLLASEGYTMHQFHFYADLLRVLSKGTYNGDAGRVTGMSYVEYLKDSVRTNKPYDQLVRELVSAQGKAWENGAVGYYQRDRGMPLDNLALATRIFLGTRSATIILLIDGRRCSFTRWRPPPTGYRRPLASTVRPSTACLRCKRSGGSRQAPQLMMRCICGRRSMK